MARQPRTFVIDRPRQIAALAAPLRGRIVDDLAGNGPSSVTEIAARLGQRPEALYYHVRSLIKVGLVVLDSKRRSGRRWEAVYRLVAPRLKIDRRRRSKAFTRACADLCAANLRAAARDYRAALEDGSCTMEGPAPNLLIRRHVTHLDADGLRRLNEHLTAIADLLEKANRSGSGDLMGLTVVLTPLRSQKTAEKTKPD